MSEETEATQWAAIEGRLDDWPMLYKDGRPQNIDEDMAAYLNALEERAKLADEALWWMQQAHAENERENLILHIPMTRDWLARYDALSSKEVGR